MVMNRRKHIRLFALLVTGMVLLTSIPQSELVYASVNDEPELVEMTESDKEIRTSDKTVITESTENAETTESIKETETTERTEKTESAEAAERAETTEETEEIEETEVTEDTEKVEVTEETEIEETEETEVTEEIEENEESESLETIDGGEVSSVLYTSATSIDSSFKAAAPDLVISTPEQLKAFSESVSNGNTYTGKLVRLGADIAFDGITVNNFTPIGVDDYENYAIFDGTFDGAGHTISGIVLKNTAAINSYGLFSVIGSNGVIENLTVENMYFHTEHLVSGIEEECVWVNSFGGIAGVNKGKIYNCTVSNSEFYGVAVDSFGGIAGVNDGVINACRNVNTSLTNKGVITFSGNAEGGIAGKNYISAKVLNCINTGNITGSQVYGMAGGICGWARGTSIINCGNMGTVSGMYVGGIAGWVEYNTVIQNCYNAGSLGEGYNAGIAYTAESGAVISGCYYSDAETDVVGNSDSNCVIRKNEAMASADMQKTEFANQLNANGAANEDWVPWEIDNEWQYPRHKMVYTVNGVAVSGAEIEINVACAYEGQTVAFQVIPDNYYNVESVSLETADGTAVSYTGAGNFYSFVMPASAVTVTVGVVYSKPISDCVVTLDSYNDVYNGQEKRPTVVVKDGTKTLTAGTDYTCTYSSNINAGIGTIILTGKGVYTGTTNRMFTINKAKQNLTCRATSYSKVYGDADFSLGAMTTAGPRLLSYTISDETVASVSTAGKVTIKGAGNATIIITAAGNANYQEEKKKVSLTVSDTQQMVEIEDCSVTLSKTSYTYDGKTKEPSVTVKYGSTKLKKGTDYTVTYSSNKNVGTAKVKITGKGKYTGSVTKTFKIEKGTQKISYTKEYTKTCGAKAFKVNAKLTQGNGKLTYKSSDTEVAAVNSSGKVTIKGAGTAKITVTAKGTSKYKAKSVTVKITVKPGKVTVKSTKALSGKGLNVTWKKMTNISGYEVQYSTDKNFKKNVITKKVSGSNTTTKKLTNLKKGKTYYVRVRAYKTVKVNGKEKKLYGSYSAVKKSEKIKK